MNRDDRGFTLVELAIASGILSLVILAIYSLMHSASDSYIRDTARQTLQDNARRLMDEMCAELRDADRNNLLVTTGSYGSTIRFRKAASFDSGAGSTVWSNFIEYRCVASTVDANANGIVDEGRVIRVGPDASGATKTTVLSDYVQQGGFTAVRTGDKLDLAVTLFTLAKGKQRLDISLTSSVALRNQP
jgi:prepilin-type N-terminal cleavage/methylation domain-containing protein